MDISASSSSQATENLRVAEVVYYVSDFARALDFYSAKLGWGKDWAGEGYGGIDVLDQYKLTLIGAGVMERSWQPGMPLPEPQLCLQSSDILATSARLKGLGIAHNEPGGSAEEMRNFSFRLPTGQGVFVFDDPASKDNVNRPGPRTDPYKFAEALIFVDDLEAGERNFNQLLGVEAFVKHGGVYSGLRKDGGLAVGVMLWQEWFDTPAPGQPAGPVRLTLECANIQAEHARLQANGVELEELKSEPDGLHWFSVADPDGNLISFWQFQSK